MPPAFAHVVGTNLAITATTTFVITVGTLTTVGALVVVGWAGGAGRHPTSIHDTALNTYHLLPSLASGHTVGLAWSILTTKLTPTNTITLVQTSSNSGSASALAYTGARNATPVDRTNTAHSGVGTPFVFTTGRARFPTDLYVVVWGKNSGSVLSTFSGTFSTRVSGHHSVTNTPFVMRDKVVPQGATTSVTITSSGAGNQSIAGVLLKATGTAATPTPTASNTANTDAEGWW